MRTLLIVLFVSGCAPTMVSNNSAGGIVNLRGTLNGQSKGMAVADAECAKFGKVARSAGVNELRGTMRYECVAP